MDTCAKRSFSILLLWLGVVVLCVLQFLRHGEQTRRTRRIVVRHDPAAFNDVNPCWAARAGFVGGGGKGGRERCTAEHCARIRRSSLCSPCCHTPTSHVWPLIVTATPRSGTVATTNLLRKLGVKVSDDFASQSFTNMPTRDGMASWIHLFDACDDRRAPSGRRCHSRPYFGPARLNGGRFLAGVHQVRDVLATVTSLSCTEPLDRADYAEFLDRHIAYADGNQTRNASEYRKSPFALGLRFYVEWQEFIESLGLYTYKVEDFGNETRRDAVLNTTFALLGRTLPPRDVVQKAINATTGRTRLVNARSHRPTVTWQDLFRVDADLAARALILGRKWGYVYDVDEAALRNATSRRPLPTCARSPARPRVRRVSEPFWKQVWEGLRLLGLLLPLPPGLFLLLLALLLVLVLGPSQPEPR